MRKGGKLTDPHERECADAAIALRIEKAKTLREAKEWRAFRREMLGCNK